MSANKVIHENFIVLRYDFKNVSYINNSVKPTERWVASYGSHYYPIKKIRRPLSVAEQWAMSVER